MSYFLVKRCLTLLVTLAATSMIVFAVLEVLPGNAAQVLMGADADPAAVAAKTLELGLDQPALQRYGQWVAGLARGDMGLSYVYGTSVSELIGERLQLTVPLAVLAMLLTTLLALAVGVYAASQHNRIGDTGLMAIAQLGIAVPNFWFAILLILLFSVKLGWLAAGGFDGWYFDDGLWAGLWEGLKALILPTLALAVVQAAILARFARSAVLEVLREDFVRTARAKGLSRRATLWGHVLRNAMIPVITVMGLQFAELLAGTIVVESVFYLPGLGRLIFQSIANRDLIVVRNCVMLLAAMVVIVNFVVDVLYALIDPRVKASEV
ncbi:MAG TPA: ABC transporter permease [Ottowia sp.]|uniref:ABC transporter permease n=1 Tax=Ottowia sp. TaxID=1898956 RepID=UPI002BB65700|nr:ABC transporter permease [Ottowia sp.]HMN21642.1 ABC transporter permease [Ottowia sp.]